ncbi:MAG: FtsX-like permease family protein [Gemmatimonadales bacterium]|nr:FtsX-like permease family protein [Gemmatimonadales bacterium]NIN13560.1 FtsX-like permease family protein [Gemmatimonadales bacterium]NIR01111.1 FtsX-like permease family protein [Gemmatimonadales bacterium]
MPGETIPGKLGIGATLRLGWRNLRRNRRRTWITAITVSIAVLLLHAFTALMFGIEQQSFDNLVNYQTGHAKLYAEGYFEKRDELPLDYVLTGLEDLQVAVRSVDGVAATTPRLTFSAQVSDGADQIPCLGVGIELSGTDTDVFRMPQALVDGDFLQPGEEGVLLGSGLAELFEVTTGDWLTFLTKTRAGAYEALDLPIVGLLGTGNPLIDLNSFLLSMETARYMLDMEGTATEVAVRFSPMARESATLRRLEEAVSAVPGVEVKGWQEMEADFMALVQAKRFGQRIMLGILVALALVGITNTILMAAYERTREIGMLMAMGLRGAGVRRLFLAEGALIGLLGGAVGTVVAVVIIGYFAANGIDLQAIYGDIDIGYPVRELLYPAVKLEVITLSWLVTGVLAALASFYPAARASRQRPVEALRHV